MRKKHPVVHCTLSTCFRSLILWQQSVLQTNMGVRIGKLAKSNDDDDGDDDYPDGDDDGVFDDDDDNDNNDDPMTMTMTMMMMTMTAGMQRGSLQQLAEQQHMPS